MADAERERQSAAPFSDRSRDRVIEKSKEKKNLHQMPGYLTKKENVLTEIARTGHRYVQPMVIKRKKKELFPLYFCGVQRSRVKKSAARKKVVKGCSFYGRRGYKLKGRSTK